MKILGIDPGYDRVGIAIVEKDSRGGKERLVHSECFITSPKESVYARLTKVGERMRQVIAAYTPDAMAMETLFITANQKTAMRVSEARGIIGYEASLSKIPIFEYSPPQIKAAVTGDGRSDKGQIIKMVGLLVGLKDAKKHDDEYDAIAVALTCLATDAFK